MIVTPGPTPGVRFWQIMTLPIRGASTATAQLSE